jgi:hypothetical protein
MQTNSTSSTANVLAGLLAEVLFVLLPIVIHGVKVLEEGTTLALSGFVSSSEWSFATIIFFGRSMVWLSSGSLRMPETVMSRVRLAQACVLVFGLCPSVYLINRFLADPSPSYRVVVLQMILFVLGLACFLTIGGLGEREPMLRKIERL